MNERQAKGSAVREIKSALAELQIVPRKKRGQNFLADPIQAARIADAAEVAADEGVLEIGCGLGILTSELLARTNRLAIVEIEEKFCRYLRAQHPDLPASRVFCTDVRKLSARAVASELGCSSLVVVSNVPYSVSTDILLWLIENRAVVTKASLLLQKEFAARISAQPGNRDYGAITVLRTLYADARSDFIVHGDSFYPQTAVDSMVIRLDIRQEPRIPTPDFDIFRSVVRGAFAHRRKTLLNSLVDAGIFSSKQAGLELLHVLGIDSRRRPETLTLDEFGALAREINIGSAGDGEA